MDKNKALEKIKKCLALSKSANANEAATALRHAQALMAKFNLSEADVELQGYGESKVDVPIQHNKKKMPVVLSALVNLVAKAFGVEPVIGTRVGVSDLSYQIRYYGPKHRIEMAAYAHVVIYRAMEAAYRDYIELHAEFRGVRSVRSSFQLGFLHEIDGKVHAVSFTTDEDAATKELMKARYGKELTPAAVSEARVHGSIAAAGIRAAGDFNLARPMQQQQGRLEKL